MLMSIFNVFKLFKGLSGLNVKNIFTSLTNNWKFIIISILAGVIYYQNVWSGPEVLFGLDTVPNRMEEIINLQKTLSNSEQERQRLVDAIEHNNKLVEEWKKVTIKLEKEQADFKQKLKNIRKTTHDKSQGTLNEVTPKTCEEAFDYLRKGIKDLTWQ